MLKLQHCNNPSSILLTTSHIKLLLKLSAWGKEALHYPPRSLPPTPRKRRNRGEIMLEKNTRKKKKYGAVSKELLSLCGRHLMD